MIESSTYNNAPAIACHFTSLVDTVTLDNFTKEIAESKHLDTLHVCQHRAGHADSFLDGFHPDLLTIAYELGNLTTTNRRTCVRNVRQILCPLSFQTTYPEE
jgi:hypothetical protein